MKKVLYLFVIAAFMFAVCGGEAAVFAISEGTATNTVRTDVSARIVDDDSFDNVIVADAVVTDKKFGADSTGVKDSTQAVRDAVAYVSSLGGGTVYFPKGSYRLTGSITVDNYVTLMGNYVDPDLSDTGDYGTVIIADVSPSEESLPGLFRLRGSSGVVGMTVWYPQQTIDDVRAFPYTFEIMGGAYNILEHMQFTVQNVTLLNSYRGLAASRTVNPAVQVGTQDAHEGLVVENLKGTVLKCGLDCVNESDVGYVKGATFSPKYWANAVKYGAPDEAAIREYTYRNACGLMFGDLEWSPYYDIFLDGFRTGVHIIHGTRIQEENPIAFMGGFYRLTTKSCRYGLVVDQLYKGWGMLVTHSTVAGDEASVINNADVGYVRLTDTGISGEMYGERIYINSAATPEVQTETPAVVKPVKKLYNVVRDYGAKADGYTDCTAAVQKALSDAKDNGGGVVYLPAGYYKITSRLDVGDNVQLRGCMAVTNRDTLGKSGGTVIFSYVDDDSETADTDKAFVTLENHAGLYGLRICYPDNNIWLSGPNEYTVHRTAYTVRAAGDGAYVMNVGFLDSYNGISVTGDNVVVKNTPGLFFNQAVSVSGAANCHIENMISNATVATQSGLHNKFSDLFTKAWLWRINALWNYYTYTETHTKMIRVENSTDVNVMSVFTFCSAQILSAENSSVTLNGCGADRMWQDGIVVDSVSSEVTLINQLKYNCMMFTIDNRTTLSIYGRMNLILGNSPATKDVEHNIVANKLVKDTEARVAGKGYTVTYPDDTALNSQPSPKNPLTDLVGILK